jgi:hypothetical protein
MALWREPVSPEQGFLLQSVRDLGSGEPHTRLTAQSHLRAHWRQAAPLLRRVARRRKPEPRTARAALMLHQHQEAEGAALLEWMAREEKYWSGEGRAALRLAMHEAIGAARYVRGAAAALVRLEQLHQSFSVLAQFRQALQMLRFLHTPLPAELLRRALALRAVGGEDLALVRSVMEDTQGVHVEHVCMARKEAVLSGLHQDDRAQAFELLLLSLHHPCYAVQLSAMYGLESLHDLRALAPLQQISQQPDHPLCRDAQRVIASLRWSALPESQTLLRPAHSCASQDALLRPALHTAQDPPELLLRSPHSP